MSHDDRLAQTQSVAEYEVRNVSYRPSFSLFDNLLEIVGQKAKIRRFQYGPRKRDDLL